MSSEWKLKRISEVANFLNHKRIPLKGLDRNKRQGVYPYYGASGIVDYIDGYIFDGTFLLISEDGENLRSRKTPIAFKASGKFWVNNHAHILSEKEDGILDYLEYYFSRLNLSPYITGAVQPKLNKANLDRIEIPIPPLEERIRINNSLNCLTDKIECNRKMNEILEQMAQAMFKSWFVDFAPVIDNALAAGNEIPDELKEKAARRKALGSKRKPLPEDIRKLFPDKFQPTEENGWIPEGWEVKALSDIIDLIGGGTPKTTNSDYWNGEIPWFSVVDAPNASDVFVIDTEKHITQLGVEESSTKILPEETTIISARGTVGKCALVGFPMAMNQSCYGVRGKADSTDIFTYYAVRLNISDLQSKGHGSVFNTITRETFKAIDVNFPNIVLCQKFDTIIKPYFDTIKQNLQNNKALSKVRDTLLPKLISGELRIKDAECLIENR